MSVADLLRLLALDGPVVGVSLVAVLVWLGVTLTTVRSELRDFKAESRSDLRDFKAENKAAHEGITRRLDRLAEEVAFLRGRQDKDNEGD